MMNHKLVKDIFMPINEYPHIKDDSSISDAFSILDDSYKEGCGFRTILVLDGQDRLKGVLTLRDMIRAVVPGFLKKSTASRSGFQPYQPVEQDYPSLLLIWQEDFPGKCRKEAKKSVGEVMTQIEETVTLDDPVAKCAYQIIKSDLIIIPVIDQGKAVGVVRLVDVFKEISDIIVSA
jgi:predicted transcriptional regulator